MAYPQSAGEWDSHRETITRLYMEEDRTLKEVQNVMEREHRFKATKRMYSIRIRRWGINKHYRAKEKELLAVQIADAVQRGASLTSIRYKDRPVAFHRIVRHCRSKETKRGKMRTDEDRTNLLEPSNWVIASNFGDSIQNVEEDSVSSSSQNQNTPLTPITPQSGVVTPSSRSGRSSLTMQSYTPAYSVSALAQHVDIIGPAERMLFRVREYYDSAILLTPYDVAGRDIRDTLTVGPMDFPTCYPKPPIYESDGSASQFWHDLKTALYLFKVSSAAAAGAILNEVCERITDITNVQPLTFLRDIFTVLAPANTAQVPEVRKLLLRYFVRIITIKIGPRHPFAQICNQLQHDEGQPHMSEAGLHLIRETFERCLGTYHPETFKISRALIRSKRRNVDLANAEACAVSLMRLTAPFVLRNPIPHRAASVELVHVLKDQQRYTDASQLCLKILEQDRLELTPAASRLEFHGKASIYTLEDIAELCRLRGLRQAESQYLALALPAAVHRFGITAPTMHIWEKLQRSMMSQGRDEELVGLAQIYLGPVDTTA